MKTFIIIIAAGIVLRALFAAFVPTEPVFDFATYLELARNIAAGAGHTLNGVPIAWQGPLYPLALGFYFMLTGTDSEAAAKVFNIILSSLTLFLSVPVFDKLFADRRKVIAAVALMAFLPANIAYVNVLATEVFFVFLLMLLLCMVLRCEKARYIPVIGVLTGLLALTKPFMLVFPAVLALIHFLCHKNTKKTIIFTAIITFSAFLVIAPWTIRNYIHFDRFIPVSYNGGYVRFINNNDHNHTGMWMDLPEELQPEADIKKAHDLEPLLSELSTQWILNNFGEFLKLGFLRVYATFFMAADDLPQWAFNQAEFSTERDRNAIEAALNIIHAVLSASAFIFAFMQIKSFFTGKYSPKTFFFVLFAFFVVIVFLSEGQARYTFQVYPLMIFAVISLIGGKET